MTNRHTLPKFPSGPTCAVSQKGEEKWNPIHGGDAPRLCFLSPTARPEATNPSYMSLNLRVGGLHANLLFSGAVQAPPSNLALALPEKERDRRRKDVVYLCEPTQDLQGAGETAKKLGSIEQVLKPQRPPVNAGRMSDLGQAMVLKV